MDTTSHTACFSLDQSFLKSQAFSMFNDQIWLEERIGQSSNQSSPSQRSSPSVSSSSPVGSSCSSEGSCSLRSWTSGVTCLLHRSIKKQSQESFHTRLKEDRALGKLSARRSSRVHLQAKQKGACNYKKVQLGRNCAQTCTKSVYLQRVIEERIKAKVKFSHFLDEVTFNVLKPNSLQALGKPISPSAVITRNSDLPELIHVARPGLLLSMAHQQQSPLPELKSPEDGTVAKPPQKVYLETDIDSVGKDEDSQNVEINLESPLLLEMDEENMIPPPPQFYEGFEMKIPFPELYYDLPRYPYRSASVPRSINMVSDESRLSL